MKLFQKAKFLYGLWQMGKNRCLSHTHPQAQKQF
jgi:hypothetical protein